MANELKIIGVKIGDTYYKFDFSEVETTGTANVAMYAIEAESARNAAKAKSAEVAANADNAGMATITAYAVEAGKANGYAIGGEIDKKIKDIEERLTALEEVNNV